MLIAFCEHVGCFLMKSTVHRKLLFPLATCHYLDGFCLPQISATDISFYRKVLLFVTQGHGPLFELFPFVLSLECF